MTFISDTTIFDYNSAASHAPLYPSGYLMLRNGTRYRIDNGTVTWLRDRNGNKLTFAYDTGLQVTTITDSLNRQVSIAYNVSDVAPYGLCDEITFKGFGGAQRMIRVSKASLSGVLRQASNYSNHPSAYTLQTYQQLFPELNSFPSGNYNPANLASAVWLPDGTRRYQFYYNSYGELARVELPTGGAVEYDMAAGSGVTTNLQIYRRVNERRVYSDGVTLTAKQTYAITDNFTSTTVTVDQSNPGDGSLLTRDKHYFFGSAQQTLDDQEDQLNMYPAWKEGKENQTETLAADGATVLRRVTNTWEQRAPVSWWTGAADAAPSNDPRLAQVVTTLVDTNQISQQTFSYDQYNNKTDSYEYDFGAGAAGSLVRRTHTDYVTAASYTDAVGAHLRSLPLQTSVYDAAGVERARSSFEYDNYTADGGNHAGLFDRPSISGLDANFTTSYTTRGNTTSATHYLLNNGTVIGSITGYAQYDIAGNTVKAIDPRGCGFTIEFSDRFGAPDGEARANSGSAELNAAAQYSYAFPTLVTNCLSHTSYAQFDYYLGRPVDGEDANSIVASGYYNDSLDRPTQIIRAVNGGTAAKSQTTFLYDDLNRIITTETDQTNYGDNLLVSQSLYDGLGRTTETRQYEGGANYITVQTQYDSLSRTFKTSNPFRPLPPNNETPLWTTTAFDALSRVLTVTTPDGAVVSSSYLGNTVTVTDQAGKARKSVSDALGRLTSVYEDPAGLNYLTNYSYDTLDNLIMVNQGSQVRSFVYDSLKRLSSATNPESGTVSYSYDSNGNLLSKTDARGVVSSYVYDALNRVTSRTYSDGTPAVTFAYDSTTITNGKGRLASVSSSVSTYSYSGYDAVGRVLGVSQVTDGQTYSMSYGYNLAGGQTSMTYPSGRVITDEYDTANRLAGVRDQSSGIYYAGAASTDATNRLQYAAHGAVSVMKLGNGLWEHTNFNNRLQPTQIGLGTSSTDSSTMGLTYSYGGTNNNGNVQSVSYSGGGLSYTQSFGYDSLNRLTTSSEGGSWSQMNAYDQYGNRWIDLGGGLQNLYFNTSNNRIANAGYGYDSAGNLTSDGVHTYGFDADNKIETVDGVADVYRYDGDGNRVRKNFAQGDQLRMVYSGGQLIAEYDLSTGSLKKEYVYGAKGLIATIEPSNGTRYETSDHLGSPRVVTNSTAGIVSRHDLMPFGEELGAGVGGRTTGMGYGVADGVRQHFTQKERDNETGLDFFEARYYGSTQGRFTSPDPLLSSASAHLPQSWNRYTYCINNPLIVIDPSGLIWGRVNGEGTPIWYKNEVEMKNAEAVAYHPENWTYQATDGQWVRLNPNGPGSSPDVANWTIYNAWGNPYYVQGWEYTSAPNTQRQIHDGGVETDWAAQFAMTGLAEMAGKLSIDFFGSLLSSGTRTAVTDTVSETTTTSLVQQNKIVGDAFRDEVGDLMQSAGREVETEVAKRTPFGVRKIDIEVSSEGRTLGGIETKVGNSRYLPSQRAKDAWLRFFQDYPVNVVRKP